MILNDHAFTLLVAGVGTETYWFMGVYDVYTKSSQNEGVKQL
jgi:hypothetical protein